jgi:hypothetical protein
VKHDTYQFYQAQMQDPSPRSVTTEELKELHNAYEQLPQERKDALEKNRFLEHSTDPTLPPEDMIQTFHILLSKIPYNLLPERFKEKNKSSGTDNLIIRHIFQQHPDILLTDFQSIAAATRENNPLGRESVDAQNAALYAGWEGGSNPLFNFESYETFQAVRDEGLRGLPPEDRLDFFNNFIGFMVNHESDLYAERAFQRWTSLKTTDEITQTEKIAHAHSLDKLRGIIHEEDMNDYINGTSASDRTDQSKKLLINRIDRIIQQEAKSELQKDFAMMAAFIEKQSNA